MANFNEFFPTLMQEEGGSKLTNVPGDAGGWTKWGITLDTWIKHGVDENHDGIINLEDLKQSTMQDAINIAKKLYWDPIKGDLINSQSIAEFVMDWGYNSGVATASKHLQKAVGVTQDGIIGNQTLSVVNSKDHLSLFNQLKADRIQFYLDIINIHPIFIKFKNGWMNRVNNFKFKN